MRIVVLVSGSGTNLQAIIDAAAAGTLGAEITAVGSDLPGCGGLQRAEQAGIPTFAVDFPAGAARGSEARGVWDRQLLDAVSGRSPDLVVASGFMRILSGEFLEGLGVPVINTHPALLPSFPGAHAVRDALARGVRVTGCTVHQVDGGVDTGEIIAQEAVAVEDGDDESSLHERIKVQERRLLVETITGIAAGEITVG